MVQSQPAADGSPGTAAAGVAMETEGGCIADMESLEAYSSLPADQRAPLDAATRGVLAETALTGRQRYEWRLLTPLLHRLVDSVLSDYTRQEEEAGPPRPPPPGYESSAAVTQRLHALLDGFEAAPFTLQRLCEVLLEPRKQYARLDKVALAIEKLLMVTSTRLPDTQLPPPPQLSSLGGVNDNPPSPYLDGRPPQVLDRQQHQALLQQQALAAAQQQHMHAHGGRQLGGGGMPNGLDGGPPPLENPDADLHAATAAAALAAAEAMQIDSPPPGEQHPAPGPPAISAAEAASAAQFVESALADPASPSPGSSEHGHAAAGAAAAMSVPPSPPQEHPQQQPGAGQDANRDAHTRDLDAAAHGAGKPDGSSDATFKQQQHERPAGQEQQPDAGVPGTPASTDAAGSQQQAAAAASPGPAAAGGDDTLQLVSALLHQHLPPALLETLLPALQQQWPAMVAAMHPGSGQAEAGTADFVRRLASVLPEVPQEAVKPLLAGLQQLLPGHLLEQLQSQKQ